MIPGAPQGLGDDGRGADGDRRGRVDVPQALAQFFRTDNLIALRELALRFVADESDEELLSTSSGTSLRSCGKRPSASWRPSPRRRGPHVLRRRAARIASRVKGELDAVHVIVGDTSPPADGRSTGGLRELTADLGARWHEIEDDDPARANVSFARQHQITQIVIGSSQRSRWQQLTGGGSNVRRIIREAGAFGIDVHVIARRKPPPAETFEATGLTGHGPP
jgi:two-component system sensor histidine kinase KdpD